MIFKITLLLLTALVMSCSYIPGITKEPKVTVDSIGFQNITFTEGVVLVNCLIENPNSSSISLSSIDYKISINSIAVGEGKKTDGLKVGGNDKAIISIPVTIQFKDIFKSFQSIFSKKEMKYDFRGTAHAGLFSIPFSKDGNLSLKDKLK